MGIAINKIIKSQSVSRSKLYPHTIGVTASWTYIAPDNVSINSERHSSGHRIIHAVKIRENAINGIISSVTEKIRTLEFDKPNFKTLEVTKKIIRHLSSKNISLDFLNPSHEGGMVLEFHLVDVYHLIEVFNDGDIVLLKRNIHDKSREVYDLDEKSLFDHLR